MLRRLGLCRYYINNNIPILVPQSGFWEGRAYAKRALALEGERLFPIDPQLKKTMVKESPE